MSKSKRTKNSMKNSLFSVLGYIFNIFASFTVRSIFIMVLSKEYLGINGLFTNILSMLSLAELGIGNVVVFYLYHPITVNNKDKINVLMNFFKNVYLLIAATTLSVGLLIMPFIDVFIKDMPDIPENIYIIYLLYLLNSVVSYFVIYKKSLIIAYQKEYIATLIGQFFTLLMTIMQIFILFVTKNFMLFLSVQIFFTIAKNLTISIFVSKLYPFIKDRSNDKLSNTEKKAIFKDIKALSIYRIASLVVNSTDNIIISSFVGINAVALYSNYYLIIHSVYMVIRLALTSVSASIGNFNVVAENCQKYLMYKSVNLVSSILFGYGSIMLYLFLNPFIEYWIGDDFLVSNTLVIVLVINFYLMGLSGIYNVLRNTFGLFVEGQLRPLLSSIINLIASILLVQYYEMLGVFIGTTISFLFINSWYDPYVVHKYGLKKSPKNFYIQVIKNTSLTILIALFLNQVMLKLSLENTLPSIVIQSILASIFIFCVYLVFNIKTEEIKFIYSKVTKT